MQEQTLDISWGTIARIFIAGFVLYVLFLVRDIVIWFFFALMISILLDPAINFLRKFKIPKILAVVLVYLSIFGIMGLLIYLSAPIFIVEINQFSKSIPDYFNKLSPVLNGMGINIARNFNDFVSGLVSALDDSSVSVVNAVSVFFGGVSSALFIFTIAFFISLESDGIEKALVLLTPKKYEENIAKIFEKAQFKVSAWFGVRIIACIFVGILSFIAFLLMGVKFALIFALISGALTFIPFVGPTITSVLLFVFVGVSDSWLSALYIIIILTIIQEIEAKALTPFLMKKIISLPPVLVLMSLLIGGTVFGFLGMIFSVPVFGIIYEFVKEFLEKKKEEAY